MNIASNNKCSEYAIEDFFVFKYEKNYFPGQILKISRSTFLIKSLENSGLYQWKWPFKEDVMWYPKIDIMEKIGPPVFSKRGLCTITVMEKYKAF